MDFVCLIFNVKWAHTKGDDGSKKTIEIEKKKPANERLGYTDEGITHTQTPLAPTHVNIFRKLCFVLQNTSFWWRKRWEEQGVSVGKSDKIKREQKQQVNNPTAKQQQQKNAEEYKN